FHTWHNFMTLPWQKQNKSEVISLSFRCWPKSHHKLGPVMWFLRTKFPNHSLPFLDGNKDPVSHHSLIKGLNQLRAHFSLSPLKLKTLPTAINNTWPQTSKANLLHHQTILDTISKRLAKGDPMMTRVSELKVIAKTTGEALGQLLYSPSHHKSLLNPKAKHVYILSEHLNTTPSPESLVTLLITVNK
ncbi:MAG: hypothetical protein OXC40_07620, partial [Proteobacteria bacterium]|nr:hypothetical protein [Pseudomonadota bacterium]